MKALLSATIMSVSLFACAEDPNRTPLPTDEARTQLESFGITEVRAIGAGYDLLDTRGAVLGTIRFDDRGGTTTTFDGNRLESRATEGEMTSSCNGVGVSFVGEAGTVNPEALAACHDASSITSLVIGTHAPITKDADLGFACGLFVESGCISWSESNGCNVWMVCLASSCTGNYVCSYG